MIQSIHIQNFQAHTDLFVEFDSQITTIIGPSDVGKSGILRAIRWVAENKNIDGLIKEGSDTARVELMVDGHSIIRQRSKSENLYFLDGKEFRAFGVNVPDPIAEILRVGSQNFQGQHDPVFWLQDSAGEVSRRLNAVVDLGVIDKALGAISGKVRHYQTLAQISRDRLAEIKAKKSELSWVVEANAEYQVIEQQEIHVLACRQSAVRLQSIVEAAKESDRQRKIALEQIQDIQVVGRLGASAKRISEQRNKLSDLLELIKTQDEILRCGVPDMEMLDDFVSLLSRLGEKQRNLRNHIRKIRQQQVIVDQGSPDISELQKNVDVWSDISRKRKKLASALSLIKGSAETYREAKIKTIEAQGELEDATDGLCPICGSEHSESHEHD